VQIAELIGIDETELRGFLDSIPNLWNAKTRLLKRGIDLLLSNSVDCEHILASTHIFNIATGCIVLLTEYLKDVGAATFKIYAYQPWLASFSTNETVERRFMNMIMEYSDKDMASFREFANLRVFICPICHAQYSFRVLLIRDDGLVQCQNCGKFVHVTQPHSESKMLSENKDENDKENLS
jgi:RNase P subunit RPR2